MRSAPSIFTNVALPSSLDSLDKNGDDRVTAAEMRACLLYALDLVEDDITDAESSYQKDDASLKEPSIIKSASRGEGKENNNKKNPAGVATKEEADNDERAMRVRKARAILLGKEN